MKKQLIRIWWAYVAGLFVTVAVLPFLYDGTPTLGALGIPHGAFYAAAILDLGFFGFLLSRKRRAALASGIESRIRAAATAAWSTAHAVSLLGLLLYVTEGDRWVYLRFFIAALAASHPAITSFEPVSDPFADGGSDEGWT